MDIQKVISAATLDLNSWGKFSYVDHSKKQIVKYLTKKAIGFYRNGIQPYEITWRTGLLAKAILYEKQYTKNQREIEYRLRKYFDDYFQKKGKCVQLDNIYNGEAVIEMYLNTGDEKYLRLANEYILYLKTSRKDSEGSIPYFVEGYDILVDGLMCCPFIFSYLKNIGGDSELEEIGINQICNFIHHGIDEYNTLPYHAYNLDKDMQYGISGWGRGVGWFLTSVAISLKYMNPNRPEFSIIKKAFEKVAISAMTYQRQDNMFSWSLLARKGPVDTSATGMILFAIALAINNTFIDKSYKTQVIKGYKAFEPYIIDGHVNQAMGDCRGYAMYPQWEYGSYPWSNGFFLLLDSEVRLWNDGIDS